jgi:hypothetical protein
MDLLVPDSCDVQGPAQQACPWGMRRSVCRHHRRASTSSIHTHAATISGDAEDMTDVETSGLEPPTPCLQSRCSTN